MPIAHPTKTKGDLAVAHAYADLMDQGFLVLFPATEHAPFDLVAYRDERFARVQVKYRSVGKNGAVLVEFGTGWADRHGIHKLPMDKAQVDLLCVYCPDTKACYYIRPQNHRNAVSLRILPAANNQRDRIHLAEDFRRVPDLEPPLRFSLG
jgi:hypothetical protein